MLAEGGVETGAWIKLRTDAVNPPQHRSRSQATLVFFNRRISKYVTTKIRIFISSTITMSDGNRKRVKNLIAADNSAAKIPGGVAFRPPPTQRPNSGVATMPEIKKQPSRSSFTTEKVNRSTFVICEEDVYGEHPLIYVKVHPKVPIVVISDTGCDKPSEKHKRGMLYCVTFH